MFGDFNNPEIHCTQEDIWDPTHQQNDPILKNRDPTHQRNDSAQKNK